MFCRHLAAAKWHTKSEQAEESVHELDFFGLEGLEGREP
jgi:hypothetical protein